MQIIFHIDMNAFFASCELNEHPEYRNKPLIVAHNSRRGIVTTASYEARKYGIHSAMPIYLALEKCPKLIIAEPHFELYRKTSSQFFDIIANYSDKIEIASIDECYVDVSDIVNQYGGIYQTALKMQTEVFEKLNIQCSIGISPNKFLSKMASDMKKPMGITMIIRSNIKEKLWPLPIDDMYGIGKKTAPKLKELGILTIGDLANSKNFDIVRNILGNHTLLYYQHANGLDFSKLHIESRALKSVGHSTTFQNDVSDETQIKEILQDLTQHIVARAKKRHLVGNNISITMKYSRFESTVRSLSLNDYTNDYEILVSHILILLDRHYDGRPLRLLGVSLNNTINEKKRIKQLSLFDYQKEEPTPKNMTDDLLEKLNKHHQDSFMRASQLIKNKKGYKHE